MLINQINKITYSIFLCFDFFLPGWVICGLFKCDNGRTATYRWQSLPTTQPLQVELRCEHLCFLFPSSVVLLKEKTPVYSCRRKLHDHRINSKGGIPLAISTSKRKKQLEDMSDNQNRKPKVESQHSCSVFLLFES